MKVSLETEDEIDEDLLGRERLFERGYSVLGHQLSIPVLEDVGAIL